MNLTADEYHRLEAIKIIYPWAKLIARDLTTGLYCFDECPNKIGSIYYNKGNKWSEISVRTDTFPSITWESEPLNIDEALEGKKCHCYEKTGFTRLNDTYQYSGVDIGIHNNGTLRVRAYDDNHERVVSQDIVRVNYCPNCGRRLEGEE